MKRNKLLAQTRFFGGAHQPSGARIVGRILPVKHNAYSKPHIGLYSDAPVSRYQTNLRLASRFSINFRVNPTLPATSLNPEPHSFLETICKWDDE
jgi:hypothetical protein